MIYGTPAAMAAVTRRVCRSGGAEAERVIIRKSCPRRALSRARASLKSTFDTSTPSGKTLVLSFRAIAVTVCFPVPRRAVTQCLARFPAAWKC